MTAGLGVLGAVGSLWGSLGAVGQDMGGTVGCPWRSMGAVGRDMGVTVGSLWGWGSPDAPMGAVGLGGALWGRAGL